MNSNPINNRTRRPSRLFRLSILPAMSALALTASAHPGHGLTEEGLAHVVTSPYHLVAVVLLGAALFVAARFVHRTAPRRALQCAGAVAFTAAAVLGMNL